MSGQNPTGFNVKDFKAASHPRSKYAQADPWKRGELWRYTGPFSRINRFRKMFPGLGIATVAFIGYNVYEEMFAAKDHHGDEDSHH